MRQLIDTKGIIVNCFYCLLTLISLGNITFIGVMSRNEDQAEFIIIDGNGFLCAVSRNCINAFRDSDADIEITEENMNQKMRSIQYAQISRATFLTLFQHLQMDSKLGGKSTALC